MKYRIILFIVAGMAAGGLRAQTNGYDQVIGVWRGQFQDLPSVTLNVSDEGGGLSGAVLFYRLKRNTSNDLHTSTPGIPEPLLHPASNGSSLVFEVSHRRFHPPETSSDPPFRFRLTLTGPDRGELVNETDPSGPRVELIREK